MSTTMTQQTDTRNGLQRSFSPNTVTINDRERFPSFDATPANDGLLPPMTESPSEVSPRTSVVPEYRWPSRRGSQRSRDGRQATSRGHRARRSLSDAIASFRNRRGSISDNAQELAEALKAPVSYKLIVGRHVRYAPVRTDRIDSLCRVVYDFRPDKHLLEIDPQYLPSAGHAHNSAICVGFDVVSYTCFSGKNISVSEEEYSRTQKWTEIPKYRRPCHSIAVVCLSTIGPSTELLRNLKDTCLTRAYN